MLRPERTVRQVDPPRQPPWTPHSTQLLPSSSSTTALLTTHDACLHATTAFSSSSWTCCSSAPSSAHRCHRPPADRRWSHRRRRGRCRLLRLRGRPQLAAEAGGRAYGRSSSRLPRRKRKHTVRIHARNSGSGGSTKAAAAAAAAADGITHIAGGAGGCQARHMLR